MPKGEYYVFAEVDWNDKVEQTEFTISSYGASNAYFIRDEKCQFDKLEILNKLYSSLAL